MGSKRELSCDACQVFHPHILGVGFDMHSCLTLALVVSAKPDASAADCTMGENVQTEIECQSLLTTDDAVRVVCHEVSPLARLVVGPNPWCKSPVLGCN
jgi:hypothetical protein